jgi:DNA-binding PadR family transcriptional regulator
MRVRDGILALLTRAPAHGYQLKLEWERLTRNGPVNVGQIYQTLERLQRDGLVERDEVADDERRVRYRVTREGRDEVREFLFDVSDERAGGHSSVAAKVLLALSTPRVDPLAVVDVHRVALLRRVQATRRDVRAHGVTRLDRLALEAELAFVEAELRWLDLCEAELKGGN